MRKIVFFVFLFSVSYHSMPAQTSPMLTFEELVEALKRGYTVKSSFYYGKCDMYVNDKKVEKSKDVIGGMTVAVYEYYGRNAAGNSKAFVAVSESRLAENPAKAGYIYQYVKARIYEDGTTTISLRHLDPATYETRLDERYETVLYDGKNNSAGAYFFVSN